MIDYIEDFIMSFFGKGKTEVISDIPPQDFKTFKKSSAKAAKEANQEFQFNHGGPSHKCAI